MHVLTKLFVVFASVLSVLLAALSISFAANAEGVRRELDDARSAQQASEAALRQYQAARDQESSGLEGELNREKTEVQNRQQRILELESRARELEVNFQSAEARAAANLGEISRLSETARTQAQLIDSMREEIRDLRDDELNWREERRALNDQINDLEGRETTLVETNRALREQMADLRRQAEARGITVTGNFGSPNTIAPPSLVGEVTQVTKDPETQDTLVRINLGTNDRLAPGMELLLTRGQSDYLGKIQLVRVDLQYAVGRLVYPVAGREIRIGDRVRSEIDG